MQIPLFYTGTHEGIPHERQTTSLTSQAGQDHTIELTGTSTEYANSKAVHTGISRSDEREHSVLSKDGEKTTDILLPVGERTLDIVLNDRHLVVTMPYDQADVQMVRSMSGAWWHKGERKWLVRATPAHLDALQSYFGYWSKEAYHKLHDLLADISDPLTVELYCTPEYPEDVAVKVKGYEKMRNSDTGLLRI